MKTYTLLRYADRPNPEVSAKLAELTVPGQKPFFTVLPGIMITSFKSEFSESEIRGKLDRLGIFYNIVEQPTIPSANTQQSAPVDTLASKKQALARAVANDDFETAARLRDEINGLENTNDSFVTSIAKFKEILEKKNKLDKPGKEDIDINNDGEVDKSDFYLLNKRRKIKKAIKENLETSLPSKAENIYFMFNIITELWDEGFLNDDISLKEKYTIEDVNYQLEETGNDTFENMEEFVEFINKAKNIINNF